MSKRYGNPQNRIHLTEPGGHILDPFAGAGTTVLASVLEGYDATGIEVTEHYAEAARERLKQQEAQATT